MSASREGPLKSSNSDPFHCDFFFKFDTRGQQRHFTLEPCYYNKITPGYLTEIQGRNIDLTQTAERQATFLRR